MAASSLLALIDDIASVLDDVGTLTHAATRKTAGVLADDLALNAQQVSGIRAERELPIVWAVAKGSLANKAILVPAALAISAFVPWAVAPLLMAGGLFLAYEGFEKVAHRFVPPRAEDREQQRRRVAALAKPSVDVVALEKNKVRGAIRTDFVLSAEIITISLGIVATAPFATRVAVLVAIALLMTAGVYGLVAAIVKIDDVGCYLSRRRGATSLRRAQRAVGTAILRAAPFLMKSLSIVGTAAMFLVGGGILTHGVPAVRQTIEDWGDSAAEIPAIGAVSGALTPTLASLLAGFVAGAIVYAVIALAKRLRAPASSQAH